MDRIAEILNEAIVCNNDSFEWTKLHNTYAAVRLL